MKLLLIFCFFGYFSLTNQSDCVNRPLNGCKIYEYTFGSDILYCKNIAARFDGFLNSSFCRSDNIYFDLSGNEILDKSFDFRSIAKLMVIEIVFDRLKGIDVNAAVDFKNVNPMQYLDGYNLNLKFLDSRLAMYENGVESDKCSENESSNNGSDFFSIFQYYSSPHTFISIENLSNKNKLCPMIFKNVEISSISFIYVENSFYRRNSFEFMESKQIDQKTTIYNVYFKECHMFDFNKKILNPSVFKEVKTILFDGTINSIQVDVFKPFKNLRKLDITIVYVESMFRRIGIEWTKSLNSDINVNISNQSEISNKAGFIFDLCFQENVFKYEEKIYNRFPIEDFCLYRDFPFEQLVLLGTSYFHNEPTCTDLWLFQLYEPVAKAGLDGFCNIMTYTQIVNYLKNQSLIESCRFKERLELCNKTNFMANNKHQNKRDWLESFLFFEFMILILSPLIYLLGLVSNIIVIIVISKYFANLKEKHYLYMRINAVTNSILMIIYLLSLATECQYPFGLYCSKIHDFKAIFYFKVIVIEYLGNTLKLISNFSYIAFSLSRTLLIGKDHGSFLKLFSNDIKNLKKYIITVILISLVSNIVRILQYDLSQNFAYHRKSPLLINEFFVVVYHFDELKREDKIIKLILIFKGISDLINNLLFVVLNFIVDVYMTVRLKRTLDEKMNTNDPKTKKLKTDAVLKSILMIVLNAFVNIILKLPLLIVSLHDIHVSFTYITDFLRKLVMSEFFIYNQTFFFQTICIQNIYCSILERFFNLLVTISFSINIFFYYNFDNNFKVYFLKLFNRN